MSLTKKIIKVAFADDHVVVLKSLKAYIEEDERIQVTHEAVNGQQMIQILSSSDDLPDVCLIDIHMPVLDGVGLLMAIKARWPEVKCIALTANDMHPMVLRMVLGGINGYLLKSSHPDELIAAIKTVHSSGYYYSDVADSAIFRDIHNEKIKLRKLNQNELAFLRFVCSEMPYNEIAANMSRNIKSIENLRKRIFRKFNVTNRTALALAAIQEGIVSTKFLNN
jgi:DNA-binding NarL/FixJ family response regulator